MQRSDSLHEVLFLLDAFGFGRSCLLGSSIGPDRAVRWSHDEVGVFLHLCVSNSEYRDLQFMVVYLALVRRCRALS